MDNAAPKIRVPAVSNPVYGYNITAVVDYLAKIANEKGLSYPELEALSGVPQGTINKMFKHTTADPRFETVSRVAFALNVSLDTLTAIALPAPDPDLPVVIEDEPISKILIQHMLASFHQTLRAKDEQIRTLTEQLKEKKRSQILKDILWWGCFAYLIYYLVWDLTHPGEGMFQYQIWQKYASQAAQKFIDFIGL